MYRIGAISDELSTETTRALDLADEWGMRWIEVHSAYGQSIEILSTGQIKQLRDDLRSRGLEVCAISSTVFLRCHIDGWGDPIPALSGFPSVSGAYQDHLQALERSLTAASMLDAPLVRIFGFWQTGPTTEEIYHKAVELLTRPVEMAESTQIPLALETCPHTYFGHGDRAARLVSQVDSPWLRLVWDPAGAVRAGELDVLASYSPLQPHLAHIHVRDILLDPKYEKDRKYCPVGEGQIPWQEIITRLKADGYEGVFALEPHFTGPDGSLESAAKTSFEALLRTLRSVE